jgi:hypothetical protein
MASDENHQKEPKQLAVERRLVPITEHCSGEARENLPIRPRTTFCYHDPRPRGIGMCLLRKRVLKGSGSFPGAIFRGPNREEQFDITRVPKSDRAATTRRVKLSARLFTFWRNTITRAPLNSLGSTRNSAAASLPLTVAKSSTRRRRVRGSSANPPRTGSRARERHVLNVDAEFDLDDIREYIAADVLRAGPMPGGFKRGEQFFNPAIYRAERRPIEIVAMIQGSRDSPPS